MKAQTTPWDFSSFAADVKERQLNFIAPYPNGFVLFTNGVSGTGNVLELMDTSGTSNGFYRIKAEVGVKTQSKLGRAFFAPGHLHSRCPANASICKRFNPYKHIG